MSGNRRYDTLDALRGLAALAVVVFHLREVRLAPDLLPHGYLAVDFFFVLSGFVIASAYEERLRGSLSWLDFVAKRIIRLYPLAALGATLGTALLIAKWVDFPGKVDPLPRVLLSAASNVLLIPSLFGAGASRHELFPGNGPLWTLSFEMAANLVWATWGPWQSSRRLAVIVAVAGIATAGLALRAGTMNLGFDIATALGGATRVCFGFPLGVLLHRAHQAGWFEGRRMPVNDAMPALLGAALMACFVGFHWHSADFANWDIAAVGIFMPMIVIVAVAQGCGRRFATLLGEFSYPVYVLHYPVLLVASGLHQTKLQALPACVLAIGAVAVTLAFSAATSRFYDLPLRRVLSAPRPVSAYTPRRQAIQGSRRRLVAASPSGSDDLS